jgi:hypothetical protein
MWTRRLFELAVWAAVGLGPSAAHAAPPPPADAPEDPLAEYRERFKLGMQRYGVGAVAEAIGYWEPIYRRLGPHTGYRLAYNLGVSFLRLGDATRAAERLQAFLEEVDSKRARGEPLEPVVAKEESDARQRLTDLTASKGRLRIKAGDRPVTIQLDESEPRLAGFVAWVSPGQHTVTFDPDTPAAETKVVVANAGEVVDISPPPPPKPAVAAPSEPPAPVMRPAPPPSPTIAYETRRPFSPVVLWASGGLAVAAGAAAIALESDVAQLRSQLVGTQEASGTISAQDRRRFGGERDWAYAAVGGVAAIGAVTAGLAAWYIFGSSRSPVLIEPAVAPERGGVVAGATLRF